MLPKLRDPSFVGALVYFDRVASQLSFSLAADELGVTTSAVSHRIKRLETALGQRLFRRDKGDVTLTEVGYRLRHATKDAFDVLGGAIDDTTRQRVLRVSVGPYLSVAWLMPLLSEFEKIDQNTRIELVHHIGKPAFSDVDLAIWWTEPSAITKDAEQLFSSTMIPMSGQCASNARPVWEQNLSPLHYRSRKPWLDWLDRAGGPREFAMQGEIFEDPNIVLEAAALGRGIALGFAPFAQGQAHAGRLNPISDIAAQSSANYFLFVSQDQDEDSAGFKNWLIEKASDIS